MLPTHFRFAGFSTKRRFARVARSEVEEPAFLSVILSGGRRSDRVEGPLYCPLTFASQVFPRSGGSRGFHESERRTSSPSVCYRRQLNRLLKNSARGCDLKGHGFSRAAKPFIFVITSGRTGVPDKRSAVAGLLGQSLAREGSALKAFGGSPLLQQGEAGLQSSGRAFDL
jgi:hypothetical protein